MGHERLGVLPKTKKWYDIIQEIRSSLQGGKAETATLASNILNEVQYRYKKLHQDEGVKAAFAYLVALSTSSLPSKGNLTSIKTKLENNPSPTSITADLVNWVGTHRDSPEYAELACRAAADTIAIWSKNISEQNLLFDQSVKAHNVWGKISGREFCVISHTFFAKLTERYLRYFVDRSASAETVSFSDRQSFQANLSQHIKIASLHADQISRHAFETAKITQSFAAGWFNKYAKESKPSDQQITRFLNKAFGKLKEELAREDSVK